MKSTMKVILASIVVIAVALSAITGITYSWWSDTEQTDITINTGTLDVTTSDYKVTLVTSTETKTIASDTKVPESIAISYGGTTPTGAIDLQSYGVDPTNLDLTISYTVAFTASVNYQYIIDASFPTNVGKTATATTGETTKTLPVKVNGDASTDSALNDTYSVSIKITSLPSGVTNATAILKNYITQKAANVVDDFSEVTAGEAATIVSQATTSGSSTTTTPVTVNFSSVPSGAANLTTKITKGTSTAEAPTAKIDLKLTDSSGATVDLGGKQTSVTFTLSGYYTDVMYYNSSSSEYTQPTASFVYYDADGNVITTDLSASTVSKTKITFTTTHFSEFVAYNDAFPVSSENDLNAAINAGVSKIKLTSSISFSKAIDVTGNLSLDLNGNTLTFTNENGKTHNIKVSDGAQLYVTGKENSAIVFSNVWGFRVYGDLTIDGDVSFTTTMTKDSVLVATSGTGAKITINGGTFTAAAGAKGQAVYTYIGGDVTINGGNFIDNRTDKGCGWLLNQNNDYPTTTSITVYGGTFTNYNPADGDDGKTKYGTASTFVANECYSKEASSNVWTVVPKEARIGNAYYTTFEEAITAVTENGTVDVMSDVESENGVVVEKAMTLNLNGYTISTDAWYLINMKADLNIVGNGTLKCTHTSTGDNDNIGRVLNIENQSNLTLTLSNVNVFGPTVNQYNRGISAYGNTGLTIIIDGGKITANHYPLNIASNNTKITCNVKNATLEGYCAAQSFSANSTFYFKNCILSGVNQWSAGDNDFATIVLNTEANGSTVTMKDCTLKTTEQSTAKEYLLSLRCASYEVVLDNCKFFVSNKEVTLDDFETNYNSYLQPNYEYNKPTRDGNKLTFTKSADTSSAD